MSGGGMGGVPQLQTPFQGQYPVQRFDEGGVTNSYGSYDPAYNNPSLYPDLFNTWGSSAQDTYDRVLRLGMSPEYKAYYYAMPPAARSVGLIPPATGPDDPNWLYQAQQEMSNWETFSGKDPWKPDQPPSSGGGGWGGGGNWGGDGGGGGTGGGTTPPPGGGGGGGGGGTGGGTTPPPGGDGGGGTGGGTTPPPGGGGGGGGGGSNWGGGFGQQNPYTLPPAYTPPEYPDLAFGYQWIPEELKELRAAIGLVPGGGGLPTEPPAVSTEGAKAGGIMSLMKRAR